MFRGKYYNKEYREGFPRRFLSTADVDSHRSRRLRWLSTAEVDNNLRGISRRYFLILSNVPDPLTMLTYVKTYQNNTPHSAAKPRPGQQLLWQGSIGPSGVCRSIQQCTALGQARCIVGYSGILRSDQLNPALVFSNAKHPVSSFVQKG